MTHLFPTSLIHISKARSQLDPSLSQRTLVAFRSLGLIYLMKFIVNLVYPPIMVGHGSGEVVVVGGPCVVVAGVVAVKTKKYYQFVINLHFGD